MMSFLELAQKRYAVRKYTGTKVEEEKLNLILEAGRVSPTGKNNQPYKLLILREESGLAKLKKAANVFSAPLAIIVCGDWNAAWVNSIDGKNIMDIDASIVTTQMMLQATELGLGTLWVCRFDPEIIRQEFDLPSHIIPVNILAIGYASGEAASQDRHATTRKPLKELVVYESF